MHFTNGVLYSSFKITAGASTYFVTVAAGASSYVNITKQRPGLMSPGINFRNMDHAISHYRTHQIQQGLRNIQDGITPSI